MAEKIRCEGWRRHGGAFSFGPPKWEQCENDATVTIELKHEGKIFTVPGCNICWQECIDNKTMDVISIKPLADEIEEALS